MKFRVVVNGKEYVVEVEEIEGELEVKSVEALPEVVEKPKEVPKQEVQQPKVVEEVKEKPAPAPSVEGKVVKAPLPGKVTRIMVKPGEKVSSGQVLLYIEAMKMENEIVSPYDGEVARILVKAGDVVETDQPLVEIR